MRGRRTSLWVYGLLAAAALPAAAEAGSVIYVDAAAPDGGDGSNWVIAFNDLQDALAIAAPNDQIWVAAGVYTPAGPNGDREASFALVDNVLLFGGFAGWEEHLEERDWVANETILSGDLNGDDGPDFQYNDENSYHVLSAVDVPNLAWLDGFTVTGGNANVGVHPDPTTAGGGLFAQNSPLWLRNCTFSGNSVARTGGAVHVFGGSLLAQDCTLSGNRVTGRSEFAGGGAVYSDSGDIVLANCGLHDNLTSSHGGAILLEQATALSLTDCTLANNVADVGAAVKSDWMDSITISHCLFLGNQANAAAGAIFARDLDSFEITDSVFLNNQGWLIGGALVVGSDYVSAINCIFAANSAAMYGGAIESASENSTFINCVFSRNTSGRGGAIYCLYPDRYINCTFSNNAGCGIMTNSYGDASATNCIFWGNTPEQIAQDPEHHGGYISVRYSDVQGGWNGEGNIDADPLFVQPLADDLRLAFGSPCVNMGDNDAVPPYIETDILGNDRFIDGIVDMGAYEGEYEMLPPAAVEYDLDQGEGSILIPTGGEFNPLSASVAVVVNTGGPDNANAVITEYDWNLHPEAEGFSVLGTNLQAETSLADGQSRIQLFIPFDAAGLGDADPAALDVTYYDETAGTWALAVSRNAGDSPGHDGPIGDRILVVDGGEWGITTEAGDWGVFWDPQTEAGFAWANVDYPGEFAFGVPLCPPDCMQPPDGFVSTEDLNALLDAWAAGLGPFDVNNDGSVDVVDLLILLGSWGSCP